LGHGVNVSAGHAMPACRRVPEIMEVKIGDTRLAASPLEGHDHLFRGAGRERPVRCVSGPQSNDSTNLRNLAGEKRLEMVFQNQLLPLVFLRGESMPLVRQVPL
jgi:hypothetical protein